MPRFSVCVTIAALACALPIGSGPAAATSPPVERAGTRAADRAGADPALAAAELVISPDSLAASLTTDQVAMQTLTLQNSGTSDLTFSIAVVSAGSAGPARPTPPLPDNFHPRGSGSLEFPGANSTDPPAPYTSIASEALRSPGSRVLLIQDIAPWGSTANEQLLTAEGIPFDRIPSSQLATVDLAPYRIVMIPSDQTSAYYAALGASMGRLNTFVQTGGLLEFHAAAWGFGGGDTSGIVLPGGMHIILHPTAVNNVLLPAHPLMAGVPNPLSGNYASHASFTAVPSGAAVVATDDLGAPNLVVYRAGAGMVVAGGQTFEFSYSNGYDPGIILANMIPYVQALASPPWLTVLPTSGVVPPGGSVPISVRFDAAGLLGGDYDAGLLVTSDDPGRPTATVLAHLHVTGVPNITIEGDPVTLESSHTYDDTGAHTTHTFHLATAPEGAGSLRLVADGDYGDISESATAIMESRTLGSVGGTGLDCTPGSGTFPITAVDLSAAAADGIISVRVQNSASVNDFCTVNRHTVQFTYHTALRSLDFGTVFTGGCRRLPLKVSNSGTDVLVVSGASAGSARFTMDPPAFSLAIGETRTIELVYCPIRPESDDSSISIFSNDPDQSPFKLLLTGRGKLPPNISISQESVAAHLLTNQVAIQPLTLKNSGATPLEYSVAIHSPDVAAASAAGPRRSGPAGAGASAPSDARVPRTTGGPSPSPLARGVAYVPLPTEPSQTPGAQVLIVQDGAPWGSVANQELLTANDMAFDVTPVARLAGIDLTAYRIVLVPSDQSTSFYAALAGRSAQILSFVQGGGVLDFQGCGWGWAGGDASLVTLPGGARIHQYNSYLNRVLDAAHPIMAGVPDPFGNNASLAYLSDLPAGARLIASNDAGQPTLVEYRIGRGRVLAGGISYEWGVDNGFSTGLVLTNLIAYLKTVSGPGWIAAAPTAGVVMPGAEVELALTFDAGHLNSGDYTATLTVSSNDPDQPSIDVPARLTVTGVPAILVKGQEILLESTLPYTSDGALTLHTLTVAAPPGGSGRVELIANGDYGDPGESATATGEGYPLGTVGAVGSDCVATAATTTLPATTLAALTADGVVHVSVQNTVNVGTFCTTNSHTVRLRYQARADSLNFGGVYVGACRSLDMTVENSGTDVLVVSSISSSNPLFSVAPTSLTLNGGEARTVTVTFCPTAPAPESGPLTITSNDPAARTITIPLRGDGRLPPDIHVTPDSLRADLLTGETATRTLTITNDGGSDLVFAVEANAVPDAAPVPVAPPATPPGPTDNVTHPTTAAPTAQGLYQGTYLKFGITDLGELMPCQFPIGTEHLAVGDYLSGYTLAYISAGVDRVVYAVNSQRYGISPVSYQEIENSAERVVVEVVTTTDDGVLHIRRRFTFPRDAHYVSVTATVENVSAAPVAQVVLKEDADWDVDGNYSDNTWDYDRTRNLAYAFKTHYLGIAADRAPDFMDIYGWNDWRTRATTVDYPVGPVTNFDGLEVLHFELGTLAPGQKSPVRVAYGAGNSLAELQRAVDLGANALSWLTFTPEDGTVPAGTTRDLLVTFNATGRLGGDYRATLHITSNDADTPDLAIPAHLHVTGAPDIGVTPDSLAFGTLFIGASRVDSIEVRNAGTDLLTVTSLTATPADFSVAGGGFSLPPNAGIRLAVTFAPTAPGTIAGTLVIASDDPDEATVTVRLAGVGLLPPNVAVSPDSLRAESPAGLSTTRTLLIRNTGASELVWSIGSRNSAARPAIRNHPARSPGVGPSGQAGGETAAEPISTGGPNRTEPVPAPHHASATATTLLIEDTLPWGTSSNEQLLAANGIQYTVIGVGQLAATNLSAYRTVIVASDQSTSFYTLLAARASQLAAFVAAGGLLEYHAAGWGLYSGDASLVTLPGGMRVNPHFAYTNPVLLPDHPLALGLSINLTGNYASHGYFSQVPGGAAVIANDDLGHPDLVEYGFGAGRVVAAAQTLEIGYNLGWTTGLLLENLIPYTQGLAGPDWLSALPQSGVLPAGGETPVTVTCDAAELYAGDYTASLVVQSNDPDEAELLVPAWFHVTGSTLPTSFCESFDAGSTPAPTRWLNFGVELNGNGVGEPSAPHSADFNGVDRLTVRPLDTTELAQRGYAVRFSFEKTGGGEPPDTGNDLLLEFRNSAGTWDTVTRLPAVTLPNMTSYLSLLVGLDDHLPGGGTYFYSQFQFRLRTTGEPGQDDWFVDDICFDRLICVPTIGATPTALADTLSAGSVGGLRQLALTDSCSTRPLTFTTTIVPPVAWLAVEPGAGVIGGGLTQTLAVRFDATNLAVGHYATTLTVHSDDPFRPALDIPATLDVQEPGRLTLAPDSLEVFGSAGSPPAEATLRVGNSSASGRLNWRIVDTRGLPNRPVPAPNAAKLIRFAPWVGLPDRVIEPGSRVTLDVTGNLPKEIEPPQAGPQLQPLSQGGPDGFGYTWIDSDDPAGPRPEWVELLGHGGISAGIVGDDQNKGTFSIGFPFPFYGTNYSTMRICANGWISPTATETNWTNLEFPNAIVPNNVIAPFWDDLQPGTHGKVYYRSDAAEGRFIVEFRRYQRYLTPSDSLTFQVILYRDGTIQYNYLQMNGSLNSATIGCEDASGQNGLTVVHNAVYVHDGLTVVIQAESSWLSESPTSGWVPAGETRDIRVRADPAGLSAGLHRGWVRLTCDDPLRPRALVPVRFHVSAAAEGQSGVDGTTPPPAFALSQNTPNPFSVRTTFRLDLPVGAPLNLQIFDATGRLIRTLAGGQVLPAGRYSYAWSGTDDGGRTVAAGFYFLKAQAPGLTRTVRLMFVK